MAKLKRITILGESPLVEEYASLCHNKGLEISVRLNAGFAQSGIAKGYRKLTKVQKSADIGLELTNVSLDVKRSNLIELDGTLAQGAVILSSSLTVSVSEQASWISHPQKLVGIGALPTLLESGMVEIAPSFATDARSLNIVKEFGKTLGREMAEVRDSVGLVLPRILCMLTNEACFAMMEHVASAHDIDTAMKLGTNYPRGPVQWAEKIGPRQVYAVVAALHRFFGEERYRPSPFLQFAASRNTFFANP